ncbi:hypothetical protein Q3G72_000302 [Acer saccharum]|nr:hypothetical protein Q3G72_000302 [Acer saccharum]
MYIRESCVSSKFDSAGDTFTNMSVFAFPPSESLINIVNLSFLYGILFLRHANLSVRSFGREDRFQKKPFSYTIADFVRLKEERDAIGFVSGVAIATEAQKQVTGYKDIVKVVKELMAKFRKSGEFDKFPLLLVDENHTSARAESYAKKMGLKLAALVGYRFTGGRMTSSLFYKTLLDAMETGGTLDIYFDRFLNPVNGDYDDIDGNGFTDEDFIIPNAINPMDMSMRNARLAKKMVERTNQDKLRMKPLKLY